MPDPIENKVRFNLKNVHYAVLTITSGTVSYGTPKAVPGAVALDLSPQGELTKEYADGIVYYQTAANNGYEGDLEMERFPDEMRQDIWGDTLGGTSKVLTEKANVEPASFALLFQIDGDQNNDFFVLYSCTGTRPHVSSRTNEATKQPQHETSTISAVPRPDYLVMARTTKDTPAATKTGWFSSVFVEGSGT